MVFSSTSFLFLFFPILFLLYYSPLFKKRESKNILLLLASLGFYAWGEPVFVFIMIISIALTWKAGQIIEVKRRKTEMVLITVYLVALFFVFKYLTFALSQIGLLFNVRSSLSIKLPIGISFFTFQLMSYVFDVYYGKVKAQKNIFYLGLYVSFFPQLIAGPIVRYIDVEDQIINRVESREDIVIGFRRFIYGLAKKLLLADYMALIADYTFKNIGKMSAGMAWFGAIAYVLQVYFDFSGYSDMAIGLGRIFGFRFNENFNYPFVASSVTDFWRRWHISLGSWFRDYVYIPLGGNRGSKAKWIRNVLIVWLLTGIWHGANWTYVLWGFVFFLFLMLERFTGINKKIGFLTYLEADLVFVLNMVIFRSDSVGQAFRYIGNMFGINAGGVGSADLPVMIKNTGLLFVIAIIGATPVVKKLFNYLESRKAGWIEDIWVMVIFAIALINAIAATYTPFIYFNF